MRIYRIGSALIAVFLMSCGSFSPDDSDSPQTANGETPIRYVICESSGTSCFVAARFRNFDNCESQKKWSSMRCGSNSTAGQMVCNEVKDSIATAYCTK